MYNKTAHYYDLIYSFKDYQDEAEKISTLISGVNPNAKSILDVACGTAEHAKLLSQTFQVDGIDLEPSFIEIAKVKIPSGMFWVADMSDFSLNQTYDVVQCLFSSIGYLTTKALVVAGLKSFMKHLNSKGIILVEPWITPENFRAGHTGMVTAETDDLKVCRMNTTEREENMSYLKFHYLIADKGKIEYVTETHELALYSTQDMLDCFEEAGLEVTFDHEGLFGRGLYVARAIA